MGCLTRIELRDEWRLENRRAFANILSDMVFGIALFILVYFNQSKVSLPSQFCRNLNFISYLRDLYFLLCKTLDVRAFLFRYNPSHFLNHYALALFLNG